MYSIKKIAEDAYWVGVNDRKITLFESVYPVSRGMSYNSYLVLDEKTVLLDTVDSSASLQFLENVEKALNGRALDYLIINHMEPDHCANIGAIVAKYPSVKIVGNAKTFTMMSQFFDFDIDSRKIVIKEGDTLNIGRRTFTFVMAPMVHWPEAMVTYDTTDKILYSADAFGSFGAMDGNVFADECDFENKWLDDARRYYTNIVGKYGAQVQSLLKKASTLEISMICPLHGPIWRENLSFIIDKYMKWSSYTPEKTSALVVYGSVHGHTENTAEILANLLGEKGVKEIAVYNASTTHYSYVIAESFKYSHIVFACATYNMSLFPPMQVVLHELAEHNLQNRTFAFIENGTWAPVAGKLMQETIDKLKNNKLIEQKVTVKSALNEQSFAELEKLADAIANDVKAL